ncbi:Arm DNA-binding domain-containing protein [Thermaurantiacus sp.]
MPRHLLSAAAVEALSTPGRHADGGGLYLHVRTGGSKNWVVRVQKNGRRRDIGLGGYPKLRLADARKRAADVLRQVALGLDSVAEHKRAAGMPSFRQAAARHRELEKGFRNAKHRAQWLSSLEAHACPVLGDMGIEPLPPGRVREDRPEQLDRPNLFCFATKADRDEGLLVQPVQHLARVPEADERVVGEIECIHRLHRRAKATDHLVPPRCIAAAAAACSRPPQ